MHPLLPSSSSSSSSSLSVPSYGYSLHHFLNTLSFSSYTAGNQSGRASAPLLEHCLVTTHLTGVKQADRLTMKPHPFLSVILLLLFLSTFPAFMSSPDDGGGTSGCGTMGCVSCEEENDACLECALGGAWKLFNGTCGK